MFRVGALIWLDRKERIDFSTLSAWRVRLESLQGTPLYSEYTVNYSISYIVKLYQI